SADVVSDTSTPRSAASIGAFTYVTCSSTTSTNRPLVAASLSTDTSFSTTSPRTSTVTAAATPPATAVNTRPSFSASGSSGRTSSATTPPAWTLTASGTKSPCNASLTLRATARPALSWASTVDAPRWGVTTTLSNPNSGDAVHG